MQVPVYRELSNYSPKIIGPFTLRQFVALVACTPVCYLIATALYPLVSRDIVIVSTALPALLAFAIGWLKPYGMTVEKFALMYVKTRLMPPHKRKYVIQNTVLDSIADANAAWEKEHAAPADKKSMKKRKKNQLPEGAIL